jgi:hypothetical protein
MLISGVHHMNAELQRVFDSTPDDEPRSRLEPYRELILQWRRQGRTYRRIRQLLAEKCGVRVADMTLHEFVQRRSRPRHAEPELRSEPIAIAAPAVPVLIPPDQAVKPRRSPEELAARREALRAAYNKPVVPHEKTEQVFVFDPDKPLINRNH